MIAVLQRVNHATVYADGEFSGSIEKGLYILLGVEKGDEKKDAELLSEKISKLRIFCDENDKMNLSLTDIGGAALVVSNFTLLADTKKGNRPSFTGAMESKEADRLYNYYCSLLAEGGIKKVEKGVFGADMKIDLCCDGPVTITLNTDTWRK